jgi:RNA polymerase sigma factor (sigma-70 family)
MPPLPFCSTCAGESLRAEVDCTFAREASRTYAAFQAPVASSLSSAGGNFPTTVGSAIRGAASTETHERDRSWAVLAAAYWKPAYKHLRVRWGMPREDARDLVQDFFERAMERGFFADFDATRARFRTFFRVCLDRHAANQQKAGRREKRGGPLAAVPLDFDEAEGELARAGAAAWESPESCFDREWRRSVLATAIEALRAECEEKGKASAFEVFSRYDLSEGPRPTYDALAQELGIPATTVTNHLAFTRREVRRLALIHLEALSANDDELRAETRHLFG